MTNSSSRARSVMVNPLGVLSVFLAALVVFLVTMVELADPARAATFEVTNTNDSGDGSLRAAITAANDNGVADTIEISATGTVVLESELPDLTTDMEIVGPGADQFTVKRIEGSNPSSLPRFRVFTVGEGATVSISELTITNGFATDCEETILDRYNNNCGGGIKNSGTLTVTGSTINGNASTSYFDGHGGGIANFGELTVKDSTISDNEGSVAGGIYNATSGTLIVEGSVISGNFGSWGGGGIQNNEGTLTVKGSTISENWTRGNFSLAIGGGIQNNEGTITVENSTISGNSSDSGGGGIASYTDLSGPEKATITNTTISGNSASYEGGGVENYGGLMVIEYSTITDNISRYEEVGGVVSDGRTYYDGPRASTEVSSSIIADNEGSDVYFEVDDDYDSVNTFTSKGYNLIGDGNATGAFNQLGDQTNVNAQQAFGTDTPELADNGGPTQTIALRTGSIAIDRIFFGTNGCGEEIQTDQRGAARIAVDEGGDGVFCDTGAFEFGSEPPSDPDPDPTGRTPLIFVPGIGGSELLYENGDEKWPNVNGIALPGDDGFLRDLKLAENGIGPFGSESRYITKVGDIVRYRENPLPWDEDIDAYETTINTLTQGEDGYEEGRNLFLFPFDWRKDVRTTTGGSLPRCEDVMLHEFIDCVLEETDSEKVNIMAHSQGGLVTQAALNRPESVGKVNKVLTLGTPFLGATKALGMLQYQSPCFVDEVVLGYCPVNRATTQEIFTNFPGAYQLLPSRDFHRVEGSPLIQNNENKSYDYWTGLINRDRNPFLMGFADESQQALGGRPPEDPSVEWMQIVGIGVNTPSQIRHHEFCLIGYLKSSCLSSEPEIVMEIGMDGGDGTVPLGSANLGAGGSVDLTNGKQIVTLPGEHGELPKSGPILSFARNYFDDTATSSAGASNFRAQSSTEEPSPRELAEEFGLGDTPTSFGGIELESVGPVEGYVEDENGNILGNPPDAPEGLIVEEIPGGQYNAIGQTQSFFLNEDGSFTSNLEVTGEEGGARLRVRTYAEGEINGQAVFQVPAPEGSDLEVDFTSGQNLDDVTLLVDEDGDGDAERQESPDSVATGSAASDTTPPEVEASFEESNQDDGRVTINASDNEGGSGIASIYYSIGGQDGEPRVYEQPFSVPLGSVVRYTATDKAGNTAGVKEIKVGDQPPDDDNGGPAITKPKPGPNSTTNARKPTISAVVTDNETNIGKANIKLFVDGKRVGEFGYNARSELLTYKPKKNLKFGNHRVRVIATDADGLSATEDWRFKVVKKRGR